MNQQTLQTLLDVNSTLKADLHSAHIQIEILQQKNEILNNLLNRHKNEYAEINTSNELLQSHLSLTESLLSDYNKIKSTNSTLLFEMDQLNGEISKMNKQNQIYCLQNSEYQRTNRTLNSQNIKMSTSIQNLTDITLQNNINTNMIQEQIFDLKKLINAQNIEIKSLKEQLEIQSSKCNTNDKTIELEYIHKRNYSITMPTSTLSIYIGQQPCCELSANESNGSVSTTLMVPHQLTSNLSDCSLNKQSQIVENDNQIDLGIIYVASLLERNKSK
eukprot:328010_1